MIYVIVPVHNRRKITHEFVEQLKRQTLTDWRLILVDDGSTDGTSEAVLASCPSARILRGNGNLWWAGSLQMAFNELKKVAKDDDLVVITNDDVEIPPEFLAVGSQELKDRSLDLVCVALKDENDNWIDTGTWIDWTKRPVDFKQVPFGQPVNCLSTRGLFLSFFTLKRVGDFRPLLLPHYKSDYEYTYRAYRKGLSIGMTHKTWIRTSSEVTASFAKNNLGFRASMQSLFSPKNIANPLYELSFVWLCAPSLAKKFVHSWTPIHQFLRFTWGILPLGLRLFLGIVLFPPLKFWSEVVYRTNRFQRHLGASEKGAK